MDVGLIGAQTPLDVVRSQVATADATAEYTGLEDVSTCNWIVVAGDSGDERFLEANSAIVEAGVPGIVIERGGIGGIANKSIDGTILGVSPDGPCYRCLQTRLESVGGLSESPTPIDPTVDRLAGAFAGRLLAHAIQRDVEVGGRLIELPYREREILPVPGCDVCATSAESRWKSPSDGQSRSLADAIEAAERCRDDRVGLLTEIGEAMSVPLPYYLASLADTRTFSDARAPPHAAGVSEDWDQAYMKGMGEALERYAAGTYRAEEFRVAHPAELSSCVRPSECVGPEDRDSIDEPIPWVPGQRIGSSEPTWLPADLVVFPPPARHTRPAITTGLALGNSELEATAAGLMEVLERDATMLSWYSTFEPMELEVDDPTYRALERRAAAESLDVRVVLLTQDLDVPVVGAFVSRDDVFPQVAAGSAAGFDATQVALDAVREALQNWMELSDMGKGRAMVDSPRIASYAGEPGGLDAYLSPDVSIEAADVVDTVPDSSEETIGRLIDELDATGMEAYVARLTTRDLREVGFSAVRVVVPQAQPLLLDATYFGQRASTVPDSMGFEADLERDPHPFP